jgi:hypothetical protein
MRGIEIEQHVPGGAPRTVPPRTAVAQPPRADHPADDLGIARLGARGGGVETLMPVADPAAPLLLALHRQPRQHLGDPGDLGVQLAQPFGFALMDMAVQHRRAAIGRPRHRQCGDQLQLARVAQHHDARAEQHRGHQIDIGGRQADQHRQVERGRHRVDPRQRDLHRQRLRAVRVDHQRGRPACRPISSATAGQSIARITRPPAWRTACPPHRSARAR